jgi:hypothetical protein
MIEHRSSLRHLSIEPPSPRACAFPWRRSAPSARVLPHLTRRASWNRLLYGTGGPDDLGLLPITEIPQRLCHSRDQLLKARGLAH